VFHIRKTTPKPFSGGKKRFLDSSLSPRDSVHTQGVSNPSDDRGGTDHDETEPASEPDRGTAPRLALLHAADELNNLVRLWDATNFVWYAGIDAGDMTQLHPALTLMFDSIGVNLRKSADLVATARGKPAKAVRLLRRVS
jgi:hypothetical protein